MKNSCLDTIVGCKAWMKRKKKEFLEATNGDNIGMIIDGERVDEYDMLWMPWPRAMLITP